jgi:hypothetical protein
LAVLAVGFLVVAAPAPAGVIYATSFENPPFVAGSPLVGQDGWVGVPILSPNAAVISTSLPRTGLQSVQVAGANLEHQDVIHMISGGYYDAVGSYRRPVNYHVAANGFPIIHLQADVRVDGALTPSGTNFSSASLAARSAIAAGGTNGTGELAISSDGHVYGYSGNQNVPTFQASAPITLGAWHTLAIDLDYSAHRYSFFVDGTPLGTFGFPSNVYTNVLTRGSLLAYAAPDTATLHKADYVATFDNFSITAVPEPASLALAGVGVLFVGLGWTVRRREA